MTRTIFGSASSTIAGLASRRTITRTTSSTVAGAAPPRTAVTFPELLDRFDLDILGINTRWTGHAAGDTHSIVGLTTLAFVLSADSNYSA